MSRRSDAGGATVEHVALSLLVALALIAVATLAARADGGRELGFTLARKLRCGAVGPGPCWRDRLTVAYGRELAGAVRAAAPAPATRAGLLPVDFRYCRSVSCATPGAEYGLTASNRRVTAFVSTEEGRPRGGVAISYWLYRPTLGWQRVARLLGAAEIAQLAPTPLHDDAVPALVPLETLDGRNQYEFAPGEEPPWRWQIDPVIPAM